MKSVLLTALSFALILLLVNIGFYKEWFQDKPLRYWQDFLKEKDDTANIQAIRAERYGFNYTMCMRIKEVLEKKKAGHAIILFEPNSYYRDSLHLTIHVPEPAVFYYYTGLEGVWINSPDAVKANFLVRISGKGVRLDAIKTPGQRQQILDFYKKYPPIL